MNHSDAAWSLFWKRFEAPSDADLAAWYPDVWRYGYAEEDVVARRLKLHSERIERLRFVDPANRGAWQTLEYDRLVEAVGHERAAQVAAFAASGVAGAPERAFGAAVSVALLAHGDFTTRERARQTMRAVRALDAWALASAPPEYS